MELLEEKRIDFIVIGVQKAGTSALDYYLRQHPLISMASKKEIHFFDNDKYFKNIKPAYAEYHKYFKNDSSLIYGEITPSYIYWKPSIQRICEYSKKIKLIAILRNPIERAFSQWNMNIKKNEENRPFLNCILQEISQIKEGNLIQHRTHSYVSRGLYSEQIDELFNFTSKENVLFIKYEDFLIDQEFNVKKIVNFLGLSTSVYNFNFKEINKIEYFDNLSIQERCLLREFFRINIEEVERKLHWDCSDWLN